MAGIRTYIGKCCADQGKDEKYLLGIIRNSKPENTMTGNYAHRPEPDSFACSSCGRRIVVKADLTPDGCVYCEAASCEVSA